MQRLKYVDLSIVIAITVVAIILTLVGLGNTLTVLQLLLGLPLVLFLPGYALTAALFTPGSLGRAERLVLSMGLSISLTALSGLVLNWTPWGLQAGTWILWLGGLTVIASLVGMLRLQRQKEQIIASPNPSRSGRFGGKSTFNLYQSGMLAMAVVIVVIALVVARNGAEQTSSAFTQLWILPTDQANSVRVGIVNDEQTTVQYHLQLQVKGVMVNDWPSIQLNSGQKWENLIGLVGGAGPGDVQALLYRLDAPTQVYRRVVLGPITNK